MSGKPVHPLLGPVYASTAYWNTVGALQPSQKAYVTPAGLLPSPGNNNSWLGSFIQTTMRNVYWAFGAKADRRATLDSLAKAYQGHETIFQGLRVALKSPECDMEFLSSTLHSLNALHRALEQGAFGLKCLAVTYKKDKKTAKAVTVFSESIESVVFRALQQLSVMYKANLNTRICSIALRRLSQAAEAGNEGFEWVNANQGSNQWGHFFRSGGAYFVTERASVLSLLRGERIDMKPRRIEGINGGQMVPHQLACDLPRFGSLSVQGEVIYDNSKPQLYSLLGAYDALVRVFNGPKPLHRIAALLTQAGLAELTAQAQVIGSRVKPVIASGKEQHAAIAISKGRLSIALTLSFHLLDQDNPEISVGKIQVTRQVVLPLSVIYKESDEAFRKAMGGLTVIDQYELPVWPKKASTS